MKEEDTLRQTHQEDDRPFSDEDWDRAKSVPPLRRFRTLMGMSEQDFCKKFGVTISTLRTWEVGRIEVDEQIMLQVKDIFVQARSDYLATIVNGK